MYRAYTDGFLPGPGSLQDQPNMVVECFDEISLAKGVLDQEDMEELRKKQEK